MSKEAIGMYTHIEKTAGVSALATFQQEIGGVVYIYSPKTKRLIESTDPLYDLASPWMDLARAAISAPIVGPIVANVYAASDKRHQEAILRRYPELVIPEDAGLVTGHFVADQLDPLLAGRRPIRGVMLREPLSRMISQYNYFYRDRGADDWRVPVTFPYGEDPVKFFEKYALLEGHLNHQTQALGGLELKDFDVVGVTEKIKGEDGVALFMRAYLQKLSEAELTVSRRNTNTVNAKHKNVNRAAPVIRREDLRPEFISHFESAHSEDYKNYDLAMRSVMAA